MSERTRHAAELGARLAFCTQARGFTGIAQDVDKLLRLSASLQAIHERDCNGTLPKCPKCDGFGTTVIDGGMEEVDCPACDTTGIDNRREKKLLQAVDATLKPYGLTWRHQTDPRGNAVCIFFPDGAYNSMGGKEAGWYV